jgi:hypothetical protein
MASRRKQSGTPRSKAKAKERKTPPKPRPIKDAIVLHVIRDVNGEEGNDGVEVELRGNVRRTELGFFIGMLAAPVQQQPPPSQS